MEQIRDDVYASIRAWSNGLDWQSDPVILPAFDTPSFG
jgi:hypothetical protein